MHPERLGLHQRHEVRPGSSRTTPSLILPVELPQRSRATTVHLGPRGHRTTAVRPPTTDAPCDSAPRAAAIDRLEHGGGQSEHSYRGRRRSSPAFARPHTGPRSSSPASQPVARSLRRSRTALPSGGSGNPPEYGTTAAPGNGSPPRLQREDRRTGDSRPRASAGYREDRLRMTRLEQIAMY